MFASPVDILKIHAALSETKGVVAVGRILKNKNFCRSQGNLEILEGSVLKYTTDKIYNLTQRAAKRLFLTDNFDMESNQASTYESNRAKTSYPSNTSVPDGAFASRQIIQKH